MINLTASSTVATSDNSFQTNNNYITNEFRENTNLHASWAAVQSK